MFEGYIKLVVWNKAVVNGKGHGGIMVLVKEKEGHIIQLEREHSNKQYIWFKVSKFDSNIKIVACYFAPQISKIYKHNGLDCKDLFAALKKDNAEFSQQNDVLLVGDFNSRAGNEQAKHSL